MQAKDQDRGDQQNLPRRGFRNQKDPQERDENSSRRVLNTSICFFVVTLHFLLTDKHCRCIIRSQQLKHILEAKTDSDSDKAQSRVHLLVGGKRWDMLMINDVTVREDH